MSHVSNKKRRGTAIPRVHNEDASLAAYVVFFNSDFFAMSSRYMTVVMEVSATSLHDMVCSDKCVNALNIINPQDTGSLLINVDNVIQ